MYFASCAATFKHRDLVVFQLQLVKNFNSIPSNEETIFIHKTCYLLNYRHEKKEKLKKNKKKE